MTEIPSVKSNVASPIPKDTSKGKASQTSNTTSDSAATTSTASEQASSKISKWFAMAGVNSSKSLNIDSDINKKLEKREHVKRQRKLQNLESVLNKALDFCNDTEAPDNIDPDWFFNFVEMAENIYSPLMQELWGKIFAVEIAKPGVFSIRTLKTLKELTQRDAQTFQTAVGLATKKKGEYSPKIIYGFYRKPSFFSMVSMQKSQQLNLAQYALPYPEILSLMDAGLIYSSEIESGELSINRRSEWRVGGTMFHLSPKRSGMFLNYYKFTPTGAELSKLVGAKRNEHYEKDLVTMLASAFEVADLTVEG